MTEGTTVTNTHYIDGYQYKESKLDFFPHAEGYVKVTHASSGGVGGGSISYNYVFNYTDHLGNIRLRYAINPQNQWLEILEEDHYYPFGLKHNGYNAQNYVFMSLDGGPVELIPTNPNLLESYKYKFQGQELEEEFGKNTYAYQWRDYDPAIARFNKIDRFSEEYFSHSPYAFTKNNPIIYREIKGDSINLTHLRENNKEAYNKLLRQLEDFTGYTLIVDDDGNLIIDKDKGIKKSKNGKRTGSRFARKVLRKAISHKDMVAVMDNPDGKSKVDLDENNNYTNVIKLDSNEINSETMLGGLNPLTNDIGMTFFHELGHTPVGGGHHDPVGAGIDGNIYPGTNVRRVNRIRRQLESSFGQRMIYNDFRINMSSSNVKGDVFRAYSQKSLNLLRKGQTPTTLYSKMGN